jgi:multidrug efflux pump subunit AcrA (membrane-fusion protein)
MTSPEPQTDFKDDLPQPLFEPPQKKRRWLWLSLAVVLLTAGGVGIAWRLLTANSSAPANAQAQPPGVKVKVANAQPGTIEESSEFIASLESRRSVNLQPRIQGQVTQIYVRSGDQVATGASIIQIDAREQQAAVSSINAAGQGAVAQLANARATLQSLEAEKLSRIADVQLNQQDYKRYSDLAAQGAVSRQTKDQYANKLATAQANLGAINSRIQAQQATILQVQRTLEQADANIRQQQVQLQYYKITAPFSGTIGDIPVKVGDFVNTASQLVTITQNRPLEVKIDVPLEKGPLLRKGLAVELFNASGQSLGNSEIFFISPNISNNTQSIQIKALLNNSEGDLRANQLIRARVIWNQRPGVLIPTTAVARIAGENFAFVTQTEKSPQGVSQLVAKQKPIKLGDIKGNTYQVLEGLEPDEKIVVSGLLNLRDGVPIIPE